MKSQSKIRNRFVRVCVRKIPHKLTPNMIEAIGSCGSICSDYREDTLQDFLDSLITTVVIPSIHEALDNCNADASAALQRFARLSPSHQTPNLIESVLLVSRDKTFYVYEQRIEAIEVLGKISPQKVNAEIINSLVATSMEEKSA